MAEERRFGVRCPARYEIVVRGELGGRMAFAFSEMDLHAEGGITRMTGLVRDQAQLHGLLERIRALGIDLVAVTPIAGEPSPSDAGEESSGAKPGQRRGKRKPERSTEGGM